MDALFGALSAIILIPVIIVLLVAGFIVFKLSYKIAKGNQALVITGGKKSGPVVLTAGGAFISPFRRHEFFPLDVMTVTSSDKETQTKTVVPVLVTWTAQLKPDTETDGSLAKAVMGFIGRQQSEIEKSLQQTLEGEVRAVVATLTPEEVIEGRDKFKADVESNVKERMAELGFKLISLNITEVRDNNGHYENIAAKDREEKRESASKLQALAQREIDVAQADATRVSEEAKLTRDVAIAERTRDAEVKKAAFKKETDVARQDAEYAGKVQAQLRERDLAVQRGAVQVEQEKQNQAAAEARRNVVTTEAETAKQRQIIEAQAAAERAAIDADARVVIAEKDAEAEARAAERRAIGQATAAEKAAEGKAEARKTEADAEAEAIRKIRQANADGIAAEGKAEAEAIREKGLAEATAEKAKAEALAENEGVNLQVTLAEIESKTRIQVSTAIATAVAEVGTNATIIDMGGGSHNKEGGDLLTDFLGKLPETLLKMDVGNTALNGAPMFASINELVSALKNEPSAIPSAVVGKKIVDSISVNGRAKPSLASHDGMANSDVAPRDGTEEQADAETPVDVVAVAGAVRIEEAQADTSSAKNVQEAIYASQKADEEARRASVEAQAVLNAGAATVAAGVGAQYENAVEPSAQARVETEYEIAVEQGARAHVEEAVSEIAEKAQLGKEETVEVAQVMLQIEQAGYSKEDAYDLAAKTIGAIQELHRNGEPVKPASIAKAVIGIEGEVTPDKVIGIVRGIADRVAQNRRL